VNALVWVRSAHEPHTPGGYDRTRRGRRAGGWSPGSPIAGKARGHWVLAFSSGPKVPMRFRFLLVSALVGRSARA
jgi:hypothetical protein